MQQRSEETRARILDAAVRRFAISGYNAASVDVICSDAGTSKGAFYHHFPSKQAVFIALMQGWLNTIDQAIGSMRKPTVPDTLVQMTEVLPALFAAADERLPMFLEFMLQASRNEEIWQATIAPYRHYREHFSGLIRDGIAEGSLKEVDPDAAAEVILSLAVGLFLQGVLDPQGANWQNVAMQSMQILMNGLAKNTNSTLENHTGTKEKS
jgi:AcrR family transcriptional regulator